MTIQNHTLQPLVFTVVKDLKDIHQTFLSMNLEDTIPYNQYDYLKQLTAGKQGEVQSNFLVYHRVGKVEAVVHLQKINFLGGNILPFITDDKDSCKDTDFKSKMAQVLLPRMHWKVMSIGNVFFTQDPGIYLASDATINKYEVLDAAIDYLLNQNAVSFEVLMINNMYNYELDGIALMNKWNFASFHTDPDMQFSAKSWTSYESYLNSMNSKYRVRTRRVYKKSEDIEDKLLSVEDISNLHDDIYKLYDDVASRAKLNLAALPSNYFYNMKCRMGSEFELKGYFYKERLVGFMSYFKSSSLWAHYMGLDYDLNYDKQLYNRMLCDLTKEGIEEKQERIYLGRTAVEIKSTLGASPMDMQIYLRHKGNCRQNIIKKYEQKALPISYEYRSPFKKNVAAAGRQLSA